MTITTAGHLRTECFTLSMRAQRSARQLQQTYLVSFSLTERIAELTLDVRSQARWRHSNNLVFERHHRCRCSAHLRFIRVLGPASLQYLVTRMDGLQPLQLSGELGLLLCGAHDVSGFPRRG